MGVKAAFRVADRVVHTAHGGQGQKGPGAGQAESKQPWRGLCSLRDLARQPWATGWEHSLTWAGSARRQAGSRAQNLLGVSDGRGASFQRPLIIQRNSLSVCVFPLPPSMHTVHTHHMHRHTHKNTHYAYRLCAYISHTHSPHMTHKNTHYAPRLCVYTCHTPMSPRCTT